MECFDRSADGSLTNWHGPYLDQPFAPEDPWGHPYVYRFPGLHSTNGYDLYSIGPDGISKTGGNDLDDISNWDKPASGTNNGERLFRDVDELLLVIPVLFGFRVVAGITSGEFRAVVLENRAADRLWFVMSILALLIVLLLPRISG